jgi:hypothetical protein
MHTTPPPPPPFHISYILESETVIFLQANLMQVASVQFRHFSASIYSTFLKTQQGLDFFSRKLKAVVWLNAVHTHPNTFPYQTAVGEWF